MTLPPVSPTSHKAPVNIAISGCTGRMGQTLIRMVLERPEFTLSAVFDQASSDCMGQDVGSLVGGRLSGIRVESIESSVDSLSRSDVLIDFTIPAATMEHLEKCKAANTALVIGTTGFSDDQIGQIRKVADQIPVVMAPNMSTGVNVALKLIEMAAKALGSETDIEVIEAHHKHKVDAPSGTALKMGEVAAEALGWNLEDNAVYAREGITGPRPEDVIGFSTIRAGDIVGEHTVMFAGEGERIEITHIATSRSNFASGALRAAQWLSNKPAGLYDMQDVLGLHK